jgi:very-short-patch-repair endonuclease
MGMTISELCAIDLFTKQLDRALDWTREAIGDDLGPRMSRLVETGLDSPLEAVFDMWWFVMVAADRVGRDVDSMPQHPVEVCGNRYRLDFMLQPSDERMRRLYDAGLNWTKVAVELDGHEFHERTKEQVERRNMRDRHLQADGWLILHYSGSELVRDPVACVIDAYSKANQAFTVSERALFHVAERAAANQVGALTTQES